MVIVYWLRHGESYVNLTKEFSYRLVDKPLTPKGQNQALQTAFFLKKMNLSAIYCSPLMRAVETAQIIGDILKLKITIIEEFREINVGILENSPPTPEAWDRYFKVSNAWNAGDYEKRFVGGENYLELRSRMWKGFESILKVNGDGTILVVGHGGNFMYVLADLCEAISPEFISDKHMQNCEC